jgi:hypothetical protein
MFHINRKFFFAGKLLYPWIFRIKILELTALQEVILYCTVGWVDAGTEQKPGRDTLNFMKKRGNLILPTGILPTVHLCSILPTENFSNFFVIWSMGILPTEIGCKQQNSVSNCLFQ